MKKSEKKVMEKLMNGNVQRKLYHILILVMKNHVMLMDLQKL